MTKKENIKYILILILRPNILTLVPLISYDDDECNTRSKTVQHDRNRTKCLNDFTTHRKYHVLIGGATIHV